MRHVCRVREPRIGGNLFQPAALVRAVTAGRAVTGPTSGTTDGSAAPRAQARPASCSRWRRLAIHRGYPTELNSAVRTAGWPAYAKSSDDASTPVDKSPRTAILASRETLHVDVSKAFAASRGFLGSGRQTS